MSAFNNGAGLTQILRPSENDVCVPSIESGSIITTSTSFTITVKSSVAIDTSPASVSLIRHELDLSRTIPLSMGQITSATNQNDSDIQYITIKDLLPGYRYAFTFTFNDDLVEVGDKTTTLEIPVVTTCTGDNSATDDITGRPRNLSIIQQNGFVMFEFIDNSVCEDAFSFSRSEEVDEFLTDFSMAGVSFTNDLYVSSGSGYNTTIPPEMSYSDDLSVSQLTVGEMYAYCVRAVKSDHYMESPFESIEERRSLTSSAAACASHTIQWEASIEGLVTTEPNFWLSACGRCDSDMGSTGSIWK